VIHNEAYRKKMQWFINDRFGMFIHWGLYAIPARGEWVRCEERISAEKYNKYFEEFNPTAYDPKEWARLAKKAGMKYTVLTAKHHDGFCLFDSKLTDYSSTNTKCKRDLVREYIEAFRAEGLKVGLYYSVIDWHHPDYPHYGDRFHPMSCNEKIKDTIHDFDNYLCYMHGHVRELCTNYGKIDIMWFDFSYDDMIGEKWKSIELVSMARSLQPHLIIDNRLSVNSMGTDFFKPKADNAIGDFTTPEQFIPVNGIFDDEGNRAVWEACVTMNNSWGYNETDRYFKPPEMIIRKLVECVSKGGNMLLNVGPDARGRFPRQSVETLESVGEWMSRNSESIYNCGYAGIDKPETGRITSKPGKVYYHIMESPVGGYIELSGLKKEEIVKVRMLSSGAELELVNDLMTNNYSEPFISLGNDPVLPDPYDTVIEVEANSSV